MSSGKVRAPAALVVAVALGLPMAFGARVADVLLWAGYELAYVIAPGWLVYRALSSRPGNALRQLALGWTLGLVLEILAFSLTAAVDLRGLLVVYPAVTAAVALPLIARRRTDRERARPSDEAPPPVPVRWSWAAAVLIVVFLGYIAVAYFTLAPLPGPDRSVVYIPDHVFHLSIAAEAKHHWPIHDSQVAGEPRAYHVFVHMHVAAISQVTGIELPVVYFRLYLVGLSILLTLQLLLLGRSTTGQVAVGVVAAALMLLVGEIDLDPRQEVAYAPFYGQFFISLHQSPSFVLGLVFFVPAILLLYERLAEAVVWRRWREWLLLTLLLVGCAGAKVSILPVLVGGLGLFAAWDGFARRRLNRAACLGIAASLLVMGSFYLLQYRGQSSGTSIDPFGSTDSMVGVVLVRSWLAGAPGLLSSDLVLDVAGTLAGLTALLLAPLVGLPLLLALRRGRLELRHAWFLALFGSALAGFLLINPNGFFFLFYGYVAAGVLSAEGLVLLWTRLKDRGRPLVRLGPFTLAWLAVVALGIALPLALWEPQTNQATGALYFGWYAGLALALLGVYLVGKRGGFARLGAPILVAAAILTVGALDTPLDYGLRLRKGELPLYEALFSRGMTPGLWEGLTWLRDHTEPGEALAVNNGVRRYFYYSAFSERRVFLESADFAARGSERAFSGRRPFLGRVLLNEAGLKRADPWAIQALADGYGVTHLLVDKSQWPVSPALGRRTSLVFQNQDVAIYSIGPKRETLVRRNGGQWIRRPEGGAIRIVPGAVGGFVDGVTQVGGETNVVGWSATDTGAADRVLAFAGPHLVAEARPSLERPDVAATLGPGAQRAGFRLLVPSHGEHPDLRVFGVRAGRASELPLDR